MQAVKITLDRERSLRFDVNAFCEFERVTGAKVFDIFEGSGPGLSELRALLYAGLKHDDPALTLEAAGNLLQNNFDKLEVIANAIRQAFELAFPGKAEGPDAPLASPRAN